MSSKCPHLEVLGDPGRSPALLEWKCCNSLIATRRRVNRLGLSLRESMTLQERELKVSTGHIQNTMVSDSTVSTEEMYLTTFKHRHTHTYRHIIHIHY
jgi:hypothetical protein